MKSGEVFRDARHNNCEMWVARCWSRKGWSPISTPFSLLLLGSWLILAKRGTMYETVLHSHCRAWDRYSIGTQQQAYSHTTQAHFTLFHGNLWPFCVHDRSNDHHNSRRLHTLTTIRSPSDNFYTCRSSAITIASRVTPQARFRIGY